MTPSSRPKCAIGWRRTGYRELRRRGVTVREASNMSKSARTVALEQASSAHAGTAGWRGSWSRQETLSLPASLRYPVKADARAVE